MEERRKYVRANGLVLVNYKIHDLPIEGKCSAFDVCGAGVRITVEKKLKVGVEVEMEIYLPGNSQPILSKGEVGWVEKCKDSTATQITPQKEYFYAGIKFTVIDEKNRNRIIDYVSRKLH